MQTRKERLFDYVDKLSNLEMIHVLNRFADWQKCGDKVVEIEVDYNNDNSILCIDFGFFDADKELIRLSELKGCFYHLIYIADDETINEMFKCFDI